MTFSDLVKIEPKLADLWNRTRRVCPRCADSLWEQPGGFKTELQLLVGWWAEKRQLADSMHYQLAYDSLNLRALPMPPEDENDEDDHERGEYCYYPSDASDHDSAEYYDTDRQPNDPFALSPEPAKSNFEAVRAALKARVDSFRSEQRQLRADYIPGDDCHDD